MELEFTVKVFIGTSWLHTSKGLEKVLGRETAPHVIKMKGMIGCMDTATATG